MNEVALIFGMQRCGSNFFLSACKQFEDLTVLGEMYHRDGVFPFRQVDEEDYAVKVLLAACIHREYGAGELPLPEGWDFAAPFSPGNDAALNTVLVRYSHQFPGKYFECIRKITPDSRLLLKIFPEHLNIRQILVLLVRYRPRVILMVRNPVDSFISLKKLMQTQQPQDTDTSDLKIPFYKVEYYEYKAHLEAYFNAIREFCVEEGIEVTVVSYESLHRDDGQDKVEKIRHIVEGVFHTPVRLRPGTDHPGLFTRQDKAGTPAEKVLNPARLPRLPQFLLEEEPRAAAAAP